MIQKMLFDVWIFSVSMIQDLVVCLLCVCEKRVILQSVKREREREKERETITNI